MKTQINQTNENNAQAWKENLINYAYYLIGDNPEKRAMTKEPMPGNYEEWMWHANAILNFKENLNYLKKDTNDLNIRISQISMYHGALNTFKRDMIAALCQDMQERILSKELNDNDAKVYYMGENPSISQMENFNTMLEVAQYNIRENIPMNKSITWKAECGEAIRNEIIPEEFRALRMNQPRQMNNSKIFNQGKPNEKVVKWKNGMIQGSQIVPSSSNVSQCLSGSKRMKKRIFENHEKYNNQYQNPMSAKKVGSQSSSFIDDNKKNSRLFQSR